MPSEHRCAPTPSTKACVCWHETSCQEQSNCVLTQCSMVCIPPRGDSGIQAPSVRASAPHHSQEERGRGAEKAHLHLTLLGLEARTTCSLLPWTRASHMALFNARRTGRYPPGLGGDFPATALHRGGSVNLPGSARCLCCGPEWAVCLMFKDQ